MENYSNKVKDCCCTCGLKRALCILNRLDYLIEKITVWYCNTSADSIIRDSKYPNFILLEQTIGNKNIYSQVCIESINVIKISPNTPSGSINPDYQSIINELNKEYKTPLSLSINCDENCCCKESAMMYLVDKYIESEINKREFIVRVSSPPSTISPSYNKVSVVHLDYDIVWLLDSSEKVLYIVPLCNICGFVDYA